MKVPLRKAVVLLSGGLDSATTAAIAHARGFAVHALTVRYGQRHWCEIEVSKRLAASLHVADHVVQSVEGRIFGGSALTGDFRIEVPKPGRLPEKDDQIPITYVPARNTVLLSLALAYAETIGALDIFLGVNAIDYSGYPDCRPDFIAAFEKLARLATRTGVTGGEIRIHAPLIQWSKAQIIREGVRLGVDFRLTHSCYDPTFDGKSCGRCESCLIRLEGFRTTGLPDPIDYVGQPF